MVWLGRGVGLGDDDLLGKKGLLLKASVFGDRLGGLRDGLLVNERLIRNWGRGWRRGRRQYSRSGDRRYFESQFRDNVERLGSRFNLQVIRDGLGLSSSSGLGCGARKDRR